MTSTSRRPPPRSDHTSPTPTPGPRTSRRGAPLWLVGLLLLLLPPVGLFLLWWHQGPWTHLRIVATALVALIWSPAWIIALVQGATSPPEAALVGSAPSSAAATTSTAAATPTASTAPATVTAAPPAHSTAMSAADALTTLDALPVKGRAPMTGYTRDQFGQAWADVDHNGCDTRNDILRRDLTRLTVEPGTHGCVAAAGTLADPYSNTVIGFTRGAATSAQVEVDHVVALGDAWQTGAQGLDLTTRTAFANDPDNLLAVRGDLNQQKSDSDAASWLPPDVGFRCTYVATQIRVKATYRLWVTEAEKAAMQRVLSGCPGAPTPSATTAAPVPSPVTPSVAAPAPLTTAVPAPPVIAPGPAEVYYANCAAARAAGAAPILAGQPGYRSALDRDGDGVACEK